MNCTNCGAPIEAKSNICRFCGTVNDVDLRFVADDVKVGPATDRPCPRCALLMDSIDIGVKGGLFIERCAKCFGLFFDSGELESLLDACTLGDSPVDREKMNRLIEEEGGVETSVHYVKCPICEEMMNRRNYGAKSGVVVDTCKAHGVWLDGGELRRIRNWARAGGRQHAEQRNREEKEKAARQERAAQRIDSHPTFGGMGPEPDHSESFAEDLLDYLTRLLTTRG